MSPVAISTFSRRIGARGLGILFILLLLGVHSAQAFETGVPLKLIVTPAVIRQADAGQNKVKTRVILRAPAPCFFICELRSADRHQLSLTDIIFKKGDVEATGTGTVDWDEVPADGSIKIFAFSVDAPDQSVSATVILQRKPPDDQ